MHFTIDRGAFLKGLAHAQSVVEKKTTIPILTHVLLETKDQKVSLTATDLDLSFSLDIDAQIHASGKIAVPAHMLYDLVRKVKQEVTLQTLSTGQVRISSGATEFLIPFLPGEEFPLFQEDPASCHFLLPTDSLKQMIDCTRFAMATEETRYYLNGLYWHSNESMLRVVATDGHRLSLVEVNLPQGAQGMSGIILSRKTITELRKIVDDFEGDVSISLSESQARFSLGSLIFVSRLIDGSFPDYQRVIPEQNDKKLQVPRQAFQEAVDRVSIITNDRSRVVCLSILGNEVTLSASSTELGSAKEVLPAIYDAEPMSIGFNARYLLDVIEHMESDCVELHLSDPSSPIIVRDQGNTQALFVLMPMRV